MFQNLCVFETDLNMAKDIEIRNGENALSDSFVADIRPSLNKDGCRHTQQIDKPLLQHFGMWGGALLRKNRKVRVGLHTARD